MGRPRLVVPDSVLENLLAAGQSHQDIADISSAWSGQPVSRSTVSHAVRALGLARTRATTQISTPVSWRINPKHQHLAALRWLRCLARQERGWPVTDWDRERTEAWTKRLDRTGQIACYSWDMGVYYEKRKPGEKGYWRP